MKIYLVLHYKFPSFDRRNIPRATNHRRKAISLEYDLKIADPMFAKTLQ